MVPLPAIRASNASIKSHLPTPTALFVGGTSGIGLSTLEHLARNTTAPTIYLVGRSEAAGARIVENLKTNINPAGTYEFIAADCTLLANVDRVCADVKERLRGRKLDIIVLSCGYLSFGGREETTEGLDKLLTLRYYARLRFTTNLLPLSPKHILSILAGTTESTLNLTDLSLRSPKNYSILSCAAHSATMTSLSFEHLAAEYPATSFVHAFPGLVKTPVMTSFGPWWVQWVMRWIVLPLLTPFAIPLGEAGERHVFYVTSMRYPARAGGKGVPMGEGVEGVGRGGAYLCGKRGEVGEGGVMGGYSGDGTGERVWEHTMGVFGEVERKGR